MNVAVAGCWAIPAVGNWRTAATDVKAIKGELDAWLYQITSGVVQSGPFEGMQLLQETAWRDAYLSPMLLGCYEEELHGELERQIYRLKKLERPKITVLGSAEGYYAIGLKRRLPHADIFIVEPDERAKDICARAAAANGVQLIVNAPPEVYLNNTDFMFMDVEGSETEYLNVESYPSLRQVTAIVEIHNYPKTETHPGQDTDAVLLDRFRGSHRITMVLEGPRNPNKFKWLCPMTNDYRWLAMSEGRTCLMGWFVMEPRGLYCP